MTIIQSGENFIDISGHSGYAESGHDIVCAAISTLAETLIASLETVAQERIRYVLAPGKCRIEWDSLNDKAGTLIEAFRIGISGVEDSYPDFVYIERPGGEVVKSTGTEQA